MVNGAVYGSAPAFLRAKKAHKSTRRPGSSGKSRRSAGLREEKVSMPPVSTVQINLSRLPLVWNLQPMVYCVPSIRFAQASARSPRKLSALLCEHGAVASATRRKPFFGVRPSWCTCARICLWPPALRPAQSHCQVFLPSAPALGRFSVSVCWMSVSENSVGTACIAAESA